MTLTKFKEIIESLKLSSETKKVLTVKSDIITNIEVAAKATTFFR